MKNILRLVAVIAAVYLINYVALNVLRFGTIGLIAVYVVIGLALVCFFRSTFLTIIANSHFTRKRMDKAEKYFEMAYKTDPNNARACSNYAILLIRAGKGEEAIEVIKRGLGNKPQPIIEKSLMLSLGSAYWAMKDLDSSIRTFEEMRSKYSDVNSTALATLGFVYHLNGNDEKALEVTKLALEKGPMHASAWDNMGQINYKKGNIVAAKEAFLKAVEYNPRLADSHYYLGEIAEAEGETEAAKLYFENADERGVISLNTVTQEMIDAKLAKYRASSVE